MSEFYKEKMNTSKSYSDRYHNCKILEDVETGEVLLATREINNIYTSVKDNYHRVREYESARLDILASIYYNNPLLWWVIGQANDIFDPFTEIPVGTLVRIPSLETLYGNKGVLL